LLENRAENDCQSAGTVSTVTIGNRDPGDNNQTRHTRPR
jgi:hypothetical protein